MTKSRSDWRPPGSLVVASELSTDPGELGGRVGPGRVGPGEVGGVGLGHVFDCVLGDWGGGSQLDALGAGG